MVRGGIVLIATLIHVKELPHISDSNTKSPISRAGRTCFLLLIIAVGLDDEVCVLTVIPLKLLCKIAWNVGAFSLESDLIARLRPIPATQLEMAEINYVNDQDSAAFADITSAP